METVQGFVEFIWKVLEYILDAVKTIVVKCFEYSPIFALIGLFLALLYLAYGSAVLGLKMPSPHYPMSRLRRLKQQSAYVLTWPVNWLYRLLEKGVPDFFARGFLVKTMMMFFIVAFTTFVLGTAANHAYSAIWPAPVKEAKQT